MVSVVTSQVKTPNGTHRVRTAGSGFPLLVVQGGPGLRAKYLVWSLGDLLATTCSLIFLDQRYSHPVRPPLESEYTMPSSLVDSPSDSQTTRRLEISRNQDDVGIEIALVEAKTLRHWNTDGAGYCRRMRCSLKYSESTQ